MPLASLRMRILRRSRSFSRVSPIRRTASLRISSLLPVPVFPVLCCALRDQSGGTRPQEEAAIPSIPKGSFEKMLEQAIRLLANPYEIWRNCITSVKRTALRLVSTGPMTFSRKEGLRPPETTFPFKVLRHISGTGCQVVRVVGLEPTLLAETEFESVASTIPPHPHISTPAR